MTIEELKLRTDLEEKFKKLSDLKTKNITKFYENGIDDIYETFRVIFIPKDLEVDKSYWRDGEINISTSYKKKNYLSLFIQKSLQPYNTWKLSKGDDRLAIEINVKLYLKNGQSIELNQMLPKDDIERLKISIEHLEMVNKAFENNEVKIKYKIENTEIVDWEEFITTLN